MATDSAAAADISGGRAATRGGLLVGLPSKPPSVLDAEDVVAICRLRHVIEPELARRSAPLLRPLDLTRLEVQLERLRRPGLGFDDAMTLHQSFHLGLLRPAASHSELQVVRFLVQEIGTHLAVGLRSRGVGVQAAAGCLVEVLAAFRAGDPEIARAAMSEHLVHCERFALRYRA